MGSLARAWQLRAFHNERASEPAGSLALSKKLCFRPAAGKGLGCQGQVFQPLLDAPDLALTFSDLLGDVANAVAIF